MNSNNRFHVLILTAILLLLGRNICLADGGEVDTPDDKTTVSSPIYSNSEALTDNPLVRVTNESPEKIMAFYKKTLGPYDVIEPFTDEPNFRKGFSVVFRAHYRSKPKNELTELTRLTVVMTDSSGFKKRTMGYEYMIPQPLAQLKGLIGRYGHTQADYDQLFNQYQWLRFIQYWAPGTEGSLIIKKYHDQVFGAGPGAPPQEKPGDAARKADLEAKKKKMKELKKSGDMAAMMALAQEMQEGYAQTGAGEQARQMQDQAMEGMQKDSWNDWVACLKEMAPAARWIRLEYNSAVIWWIDGQDFWKQPKSTVNKR
jgi:antitoxin component HigA of HigAB toxin-antitoxin module